MENSVSNRNHGEASEFSASYRACDLKTKSYFGIYNSTGKLLKGNELLEQYTDLAIQLDAKRSAFYLESNENNIIFGCSLIVKADNGREERAVFVQVNKNISLRDRINFDIQLLNTLYKRVKYEVENLELNKYQLIGLWSEGDFQNIKESLIEKDFLDYTVGKLHSGKKVSIRITELSNGLSFFLKLIDRLRNMLSFTLDISQYPSESNISISLMKQNPDFEIVENGMCRELTQKELWNLYKKQGRENQSLVESVIKEVESGQINNSGPSDVIYSDLDDGLKVEIFIALLPKADSPYFKKVLTSIYNKIEAPERRRDLHRILLGRSIFIEELVKDLVITIYREHNRELFNLLFKRNTSQDSFSSNNLNIEFAGKNSRLNSKYDSFEKGIKDSLNYLNYSEKVGFLQLIANEAPSKPKVEGKILLKSLIEHLVISNKDDFILKITEVEARNLDEILDTNYLDARKRLKKQKRNRKIKICSIALVAIVILFVLIVHRSIFYNDAKIIIANFVKFINITNFSN